MKRHAFLSVIAAVAACAPFVSSAAPQPVRSVADLKTLEKETGTLVEKVMPATVALVSEKTGSSGSGVITTADGLILTAAHVIQGVDDLLVVFPNGRQINGRVLGANLSKDIGLVKIDEPGPWPYVERGSSRSLAAGDWVVAMGHSAGFDPNRTPPVRFGRVVSRGPGNFFTSDCTLIGGDSGGPIFDIKGRIVGINSSIGNSKRNNNHAGVDGFREDWDRLMAGETWGELSMNPFANPETPVLGIGMGREGRSAGGVPVERITPRSPAAAAGVRVGDILTSIDGEALSNGRALQLALAKKEAGDKIRLGLTREQTKLDLEITLVKRGSLYDHRSLRGIPVDPVLFDEKREVPLVSASENETLIRQAAELFKVSETVASPYSVSAVQIYIGEKPAAYGTVVGTGNTILTKWSEIANKAGVMQALDHKEKAHPVKVTGVYEDEDIAVLSFDGPALTPVKWAEKDGPGLGRFVVAPRRDGKGSALGVVSVLPRSLRETDQAFLGVGGDTSFAGPGVKAGSVEPKTGAAAAGIRKGDIILKVGDRAVSGVMELRNSLLGKNPGDKVTMKVVRDGKEMEVEVTLGSRPQVPQFSNPRLRQMEKMGGEISKVRDFFPSVLQTDLQLTPRQCGGPVVDLDGRVIGVTIAQSDRTRSFVIPAADIVAMLKRPATDPSKARVGDPAPDSPAVARRNQPRELPPIDPEAIGKALRNVRDMERLRERLREEMDSIGEAR